MVSSIFVIFFDISLSCGGYVSPVYLFKSIQKNSKSPYMTSNIVSVLLVMCNIISWFSESYSKKNSKYEQLIMRWAKKYKKKTEFVFH